MLLKISLNAMADTFEKTERKLWTLFRLLKTIFACKCSRILQTVQENVNGVGFCIQKVFNV